MRNYPEVPDWWYGLSFLLFFSCMIIAMEVRGLGVLTQSTLGANVPLQVWHTTVPVWALLLAVILPVIYVLPSGFIFAMTGQGVRVATPPLSLLLTLLPSSGFPQPSCPDHSRDTPTRKPTRKHGKPVFRCAHDAVLLTLFLIGVQGVCGADAVRGDVVRVRLEARSLYQGSTTGDLCR